MLMLKRLETTNKQTNKQPW